MKIVIATDSYKGSLTSIEVANHIEKGLLKVFPQAQITKIPIADGGEGTVEAMISATSGSIHQTVVKDPLGKEIQSFFGVLGDGKTAVIEMAAASGLTLVPFRDRNPLITSSFGTGQLIRHVIKLGLKKIILGIGGSATNDGGAGMAEALGVRFLDKFAQPLVPGGAALIDLKEIDLSQLDPAVKETEILVACDVDNPLCGIKGASAVYGPQKGATGEMVALLDSALKNYSLVAAKATGRDVSDIPGSGAAGGMGAGLLLFTKASLRSGVQIVIETTGLEELVKTADLIITGEGKTDKQTSFGKAPVGVGELARKYDKVALCLSGSLGEGADDILNHGIHAITNITEGPVTLEECIQNADKLLERSAFRLGLTLRAGVNLAKALGIANETSFNESPY
ncbi:MAG: glycerate kinase [Desulfomonilaceae bacterium]